MICAKFSI
jgi:hypothetical protein